MQNIYQPIHFDSREFVPPEVWAILKERSLILMDYRILKTADAVREYFGTPMTINNWHQGGERKYSGFRPCECPIGERYSQHRYGRAIDFLIDGIESETVRKEIIEHQEHFSYITAMESGTSWIHIDCRPIVNDKIEMFKS